MATKKRARIAGLDGLRVLALVGVLLYHMFPKMVPGGFFGVVLFFVISGYLAGVSGVREYRAGKFSILQYYKKRLVRIYPALIAVMLVSIGALTLIDVNRMANIPSEVLSVLLGYNNYWQLKMNASYFTNLTNTSMFTHFWYVAILIQFEVLWPLLLSGYGWVRKNKGVGSAILGFFVLTVILYLVMPVSCLFTKEPNITALYYGTTTRVFSLAGGAFLGILHGEGVRMQFPYRTSRFLGYLLTVAFIAVSVLLYIKGNGTAKGTYLYGMALYTLFCVLTVDCVTEPRNGIGKVLDVPPMSWISAYSYEIYLWQYPVLFLTGIVMGKGNPYVMYAVQAVLIILLSVWLHFFTAQISRMLLPKK